MGPVQKSDGTQSLTRALRLLTEVARADGQKIRLTDLVGKSGLGTSTAYRLLSCLVEEGFLDRGPDRRYRLGHRSFELGLVAQRSFRDTELAHPILADLANALDKTVFLSVRSADESVCIDRVDHGEINPLFRTRAGTRQPLGVSVCGIAILASMEPTKVEQLARAIEPAYRRYARTTPAQICRRVDESRMRGFAQQESSYFTGKIVLAGIGIVVPLPNRPTQLAISVGGPASQFDHRQREAALPLVSAAAKEVARLLTQPPMAPGGLDS